MFIIICVVNAAEVANSTTTTSLRYSTPKCWASSPYCPYPQYLKFSCIPACPAHRKLLTNAIWPRFSTCAYGTTATSPPDPSNNNNKKTVPQDIFICLSGNFRLWQSLSVVRHLHNSASKKGCMAGLNGISQMDMALTQFGFMGFALSRSRKMGIYENDDEEFLAYTHIWRVVGYLMGIEDR